MASPMIAAAPAAGFVDTAGLITVVPALDLFMPAEGEVVLGPVVMVAGRVSSNGRSAIWDRPSRLHIELVVDDQPLGESDVEVIGQDFIAFVRVAPRLRGTAVELRVSDPEDPSEPLLLRDFVVGPSRGLNVLDQHDGR